MRMPETENVKLAATAPAKIPAAKRRNRELSKAKLLKAAIEVFSKFGFDGATTKMIAARARVNESLINRYFKSKDGLLGAVTEQFVVQTADYVIDFPPCPTLEQELISYARHRFEYDISHKNLVRITISQCALDPKLCRKIQEVLPMRGDLALQQRLEALMVAGQIRRDANLEEVSRSLGFQVFSSAFLAHMVFGLDKNTILETLEHFCTAYARGLSNPTS